MDKEVTSNQFFVNVSKRLSRRGFTTRITEEGKLAVRHEKVPGNVKLLCVIEGNGAVYCNSIDLKNPFKRKFLEEVMDSICEVVPPTRQQNRPQKRSRGGMERE